MRIIDLSHPITPDMQVYPGDPAVAFEAVASVAVDGVAVAALHLGTHSGTHVDAPSHCIQGGPTIDRIDPLQFTGAARIVDATGFSELECITLGHLHPHLHALRPDDVVLIHTGWSKHFGSPTYLRHPFLDPAVADHLSAAGISAVGVDLLSPDPTDEIGALPFHESFLGSGGVIFENLTNLAAAAAVDCTFFGLPLRLDGLDGSPVRAIAVVE